jgi:hypothetical protein
MMKNIESLPGKKDHNHFINNLDGLAMPRHCFKSLNYKPVRNMKEF